MAYPREPASWPSKRRSSHPESVSHHRRGDARLTAQSWSRLANHSSAASSMVLAAHSTSLARWRPDRYGPLQSRPVNPMSRAAIEQPLDVGVRAINALLCVGRGQRMGLFAGSGVGKSVLLGMMARYTEADVIVVGLIGERGREVKEFIEQILGEEGLRRSVVIAAPADVSPLMRLQGAAYATCIAEYFRDRGRHVLLIMDSLTRYAMAQREIALAIGEPPVTRGYPPSVFARLPQLVERAGNGADGGGSITGFYTVLAEGDDQQDPIADSARAILDGHIVLSRTLADAGHYPAIDIEQSISRAMVNLVSPAHLDNVRRFKGLFSRYQRSRDLISVGAYAAGSDLQLDQAIAIYPKFEVLLQQNLAHAPTSTPASRNYRRCLLPTPDPRPGGPARQPSSPNGGDELVSQARRLHRRHRVQCAETLLPANGPGPHAEP
jgi:FliI/YscN family ATPase